MAQRINISPPAPTPKKLKWIFACKQKYHKKLRGAVLPSTKVNPWSTSDRAPAKGFSVKGLTQRLWNIDWHSCFPLKLSNTSVSASLGNFEKMSLFTKQNFLDIYEYEANDQRFLPIENTESRVRYYEEAVDIFLFEDERRVVGIFTGNPLDWSTYYIRNCSILEAYQNQGILQSFLPCFLGRLKEAGVVRVETDISPSNLVNIHVLNKAKFNITGMNMSERWGSILRFTKFLKENNESTFLDQFCFGVRYQKKPTSS